MIGCRVLPPLADHQGAADARQQSWSAVWNLGEDAMGTVRPAHLPCSSRHAEQTEPKQAAKLAHARIMLAAPTASRLHGKPDLIASGKAIVRQDKRLACLSSSDSTTTDLGNFPDVSLDRVCGRPAGASRIKLARYQ